MEIFLLTFIVMLAAIAGMAIGVMFKRAPIRGSCGGLNRIQGAGCVCSEPCERRKKAMGYHSFRSLE